LFPRKWYAAVTISATSSLPAACYGKEKGGTGMSSILPKPARAALFAAGILLGGSVTDYFRRSYTTETAMELDKTGAEGKGSIKIFSIADVGGSATKSSETSTVCRVKFTIPIIPPVQRTT
jgi:hypothetical protein